MEKHGCLDSKKLLDYFFNDYGYAIHIDKLEAAENDDLKSYIKIADNEPATRAPESYLRCRNINSKDQELYILISVEPIYLVDILNEKKTIEFRKK